MNKKKTKIDGLTRPVARRKVGATGVKTGKRKRNLVAMQNEESVVKNTTLEEKSVLEIAEETTPMRPEPKELGDFSDDKESLEDLVKSIGEADLEITSDEVEKEQKGKKRKDRKVKKEKKKWSKKRKALLVLAILLVLIAGGAAAALIWGNTLISRITNGASGIFDVFDIQEDVKLKADSKGRTNVLVFGTSGYDMGGSNHDGAQLTDSIMVISLDQETGDTAMLSLPRDLLVDRTCTATGKVNEIYWCFNQDGNDEIAGAEALRAEVEEILGIEIQYYAHLNWGALITLVDSVNGIMVTLDEDIADSWTKTYIDAGVPTWLNGEQALGLARARHGTASGDFTRGNSQQKIIVALKERMEQNGVSLTDAINILNSLGDNLRMNLNLDEVKSVYNIVREMDLSNIRQVPLISSDWTGENYMTTATYNGISYVVPIKGTYNYSDLQAYVARMFSSDAAVRENAKIMVLNGSGVAGVAATERDGLTADGYNVTVIDDAPAGKYTEKYYVYQIGTDAPGTGEALAKRYGVTLLGGEALPWGVDGSYVDYVVIVGEGE